MGPKDSRQVDAIAGELGLRRIHHVRVVLGAPSPYAEVTGATRLPRTVRTSLATANRLVRAGAPVVWCDAPG